MTYSLKWLFGLILLAAVALGWWRSLNDAYERGFRYRKSVVQAVGSQWDMIYELSERQQMLETKTTSMKNWMNFNNQDFEERLRELEESVQEQP